MYVNVLYSDFCFTLYFCIHMHVLYIYCFLSDNVIVMSCSSRYAIDELECRARGFVCLSLNKLFVVCSLVKSMQRSY